MSEAERARYLAAAAEYDCAPWSLIVDYDAELLTPEEYTAYGLYPFVPASSGFRSHEFPLPLPIPERYELCAVGDGLPVDGALAAYASASRYVEDLEPEFRDRLWLWHTGQTYADATRPSTDDEVADALCQFDPEHCD